MSYDSGVRDEIFQRLGVYVKWWYQLDEMKGSLDALLDSAVEALNMKNVGDTNDAPSEADKLAYEAFSAEIHRQKTSLESLRYGVVNLVGDFIGVNVKDLLDSPYTSPTDIMDHLLDLMDDSEDKVEANVVSKSAVTGDEDNSLDTVGVTLDEPTQSARDDVFSLVCTDASTVDREQWTLYSGRLGQFSGQVVTGTAVDWAAAGLSNLAVAVAPNHDETGDTAAVDKVSNVKLTGAVKGANVAEDGRVWLKFKWNGLWTVENDELGQTASWGTAASQPVFGVDTDPEGKVYASLVKDPASYTVLGGTMAVVDASGIIIEDADSTNTNDGTLYVTVRQVLNTDETRDFTVELYSDAARTHLEASGTAGGDSDVTVPLEAESGGVSGEVRVSEFNSTKDTFDDTILIKVPKYCIRMYRSAARTEDDLVAEGASYIPKNNSVNIFPPDLPPNFFVHINYIQDNEEIVVNPGFFTLDMYKADPSLSTTTDADIVARAGTLSILPTLQQAGFPFYAINGSGLTGVTVDLASVEIEIGDVVSTVVGYAVGDKFTFSVSVNEERRFQTFLRDNYEKVFPSATGPSANIPDSLAGAV